MLYTIAQLSELLNKAPKTIYRAHVQYMIGTLQETEEGRRLLFTSEEYEFLEQLFAERRKEKLLSSPDVKRIIHALKKHPMTAYDLARHLHMHKSTVQGLLVSMSTVFDELLEDAHGILYFGTTPPNVVQEGSLVRHVFLSHITGEILWWTTYTNTEIPEDSAYSLLMTDKCFYQYDKRGKIAFENDVVEINGEWVPAYIDMPKGFVIIGNLHHRDISYNFEKEY